MNKKAAALLIVLGVILVVSVLVNVVLQIMLNQSKLSQHQISRIQAYYAANAGIVYAFEKLRTGDYVPGTDCNSDVCNYTFSAGDYVPANVRSVSIQILTPGQTTIEGLDCSNPPTGVDACINATVDYTPAA